MKKENNQVTVGLCEGRHEMPVTEFIFGNQVDPTDFAGMENTCREFVKEHVGIVVRDFATGVNQASNDDTSCFAGEKELVVYVTGLTACTAALIKVCMMNGVRLTLMHFDRETGAYLPQRIY